MLISCLCLHCCFFLQIYLYELFLFRNLYSFLEILKLMYKVHGEWKKFCSLSRQLQPPKASSAINGFIKLVILYMQLHLRIPTYILMKNTKRICSNLMVMIQGINRFYKINFVIFYEQLLFLWEIKRTLAWSYWSFGRTWFWRYYRNYRWCALQDHGQCEKTN